MAELGERYGLEIDPKAKIWQLSVGEQQRVEILKALYRDARILIMDEPTAVLTPQEAERLFETLRAMADEGRTIIFISHKLHEVLAVASRVTVLRGGRNVATVPAEGATLRSLAARMVGGEIAGARRVERARPVGEVVVSLEGVSVAGDRGALAVHGVSLDVRAGEIVGVAGVAIFASRLEPDYDSGRLSSRAFYQEITRLFQVDVPYSQFCEWWQDIFAPMEGMAAVVKALALRDPLFLLSNTNDLHFPYVCRHFPLVHRISRHILSYQVGSRKPEAGIYQALVQAIERPPAQCLFVDDKAPFVEAARTHGLTAWQFTTPQDFILRLRQHSLYEP